MTGPLRDVSGPETAAAAGVEGPRREGLLRPDPVGD